MAVQFPDLNPGGPSATSNDKNVHTKVVRLLAADFATGGGVVSVKLVLPADSTMTNLRFWKKTQLSGGGITAATVSIGIPGTPTQFVTTYDVLTPVAGTLATVTPISNIYQNYNIPQGSDLQIQFTGVATTGAPTAGELYFAFEFVR